MPDSKLKELAIEALTNLNARKPSRLAKAKDIIAVVSSLLALPTAFISVVGLLQQTRRAEVAVQQKSTVQAIADSHLQTTRTEVQQLRNTLVSITPSQENKTVIDEAITRATTIEQGIVGAQTQLQAAATEQNIPPAVSGWQVVIGDYKNQMEALQKQQAAAKLGYLNSEIYGEPPHLHMRFRFSSKQDATTAAQQLKAARIAHEPDVVPYRPK